MIKFIKSLFGIGSAEPTKVVAPASTAADLVVANATGNVPLTTYIPPAKPINKVRAVGDSGVEAVKAAVAPKPANKQRTPYKGNKPKGVKNAGGTVAKVNQPKPQAKQAPNPAKKK